MTSYLRGGPSSIRFAAMRHRGMAWTRITPSLQRRAHLGIAHAVPPENTLTIRHRGTLHGAFMEPSGGNRWQPVAKGRAPKMAQTNRLATGGNPRQRFRMVRSAMKKGLPRSDAPRVLERRREALVRC